MVKKKWVFSNIACLPHYMYNNNVFARIKKGIEFFNHGSSVKIKNQNKKISTFISVDLIKNNTNAVVKEAPYATLKDN